MSFVVSTYELSHNAALTMLHAAVSEAERINVPECIVIVDPRGRVLASLRMSDAKFMSLDSATAKAVTAASNGTPSGTIPAEFAPAVAAATGGLITNLRGGLPVRIDGVLTGAIGVGSGSPEQDLLVANAALGAIDAEQFPAPG